MGARKKRGNKKNKKHNQPQKAEPKVPLTNQQKAVEEFINKNYLAAIQLFTKAIKDEEKNPEVVYKLYSNRSTAFAHLRMFPKALEDADTVIKMKPEWPKGYIRKARALQGMVRFDEAQEVLEYLVKLDPTDANRTLLSNNPSDTMIEWLLNGNSKFEKLYLKNYDDEYRGVHTTTNIPPEEIITEIPLEFIMTTEIAKESEIGKKIIGSGVHISSQHSYLACYLLQEVAQGKKSRWLPYIRCLPVKYHTMPINFTDYEKSFLVGSFSLDKMKSRVDSLNEEYNRICEYVPEFKDIATYDQFVWARHVVITRIFGMVIHGNVKTNGLVPMADMLNHKRPRETKWTYDKKRKAFTITSLKQLHKDAQVFDSYGRKCNHRFFVNYGFSLDYNEDNEVVLKYQLSPNDPLLPLKTRFLGDEERTYQIPANSEHEKTMEMFSFLRLFVAENPDIKAFSALGLGNAGSNFKLDSVKPVNLENERRCLIAARDAAQRCLKGFETTLEEDRKILKANEKTKKLTFNIRNAIIMRRGEKEVCHFFIDLADIVMPCFGMSVEELKKKIKSLKKKKKIRYNYYAYIQRVILPLTEANEKKK